MLATLLAASAAFTPTTTPIALSTTKAVSQPYVRTHARMGLFDSLKKAFDNVDYSNSPARYEQTNARASHILVPSEEQAQSLKDKIAAGELTFDEAAMQYSTCNSAKQGGRLGKFSPGTMVKEFDDVVFGLRDTGEFDIGTNSNVFEPLYELDVVHGPVGTKFGYHLIKIETRNLADFDFRSKETAVGKKDTQM